MIRTNRQAWCGGLLFSFGCFLLAGIGNIAITKAESPATTKSGDIKALALIIEQADFGDIAMVQRLAQEADALGYKDLADILDMVSQDDGSNPEYSAHLELAVSEAAGLSMAEASRGGQGGVAAPPANDACASATVISTVPYVNSVSAAEATDDTNNPSCDSSGNTLGANNGVWYSYTPPATCTAQLSEGSATDTAMSIWEGGTCATLVQTFCTDPESGTKALFAGTTYYILISTWGTGTPTGNYTLAFDCTVFATPDDDCAGATVISSVPYVGASSAPGANDDTTANPSCDSSSNTLGANNGKWWSYTASSTCTATISELSSLDVAISVWTGACATPVQALCSDPETGISQVMTGGTTYYIMISAWSSTNPASGNYTLTFDCQPPPANDGCAAATTVTDGVPASTGNNCTASATDDGEASCQANSNKDVWFSYTATCNGAANMTTEGSVQTDTTLSAYSSCGGMQVGCDDDGGTGLLSNMTFSVSMGTVYKIRLASFSTGCGVYNLNISCLAAVCGNNTVEPGEACDGTGPLGSCIHGCTVGCQCAAPANDHCANAAPALDGVVLLNRAFATTDGAAQPLPPCDFPFGDDQLYYDVWLDYTASCTGRLLVDTCNGAGLDTRLAVYPGCGCPAAADPISCNDDSGATDELSDADQDPDTCNQLGGSPFESATRNQVVAGNCYKIRLGAFSSTASSSVGADELFIQCISKGSCCDANGVCTAGVIASECPGTLFVGSDCTPESCCINDVCSLLAPECCQQLGGTPGGPGSDCDNCGNGIVDCGEQCDGGDCCTAQCTYTAAGVTCRASSDDCDAEESCDGMSAACPPDGFTTGNVCRPAAGDCDAPESCDGSGPACPADMYLSGNTCRMSSGPCDPAENCDGSGVDCPADVVITMCINDDGCCPATCNGNTDNDCPPVVVPTVSEWGLAILVLIGLIAGTFLFKRKVAVSF